MMNQYWGIESPTTSDTTAVSQSDLFVESNRIHFVSEITQTSAGKLIHEIRKLDLALQKASLEYGINSIPIELRLSSNGGGVLSGFSIMDAILECVSPINTYVDGYVASSATLLSVVGDRRYMGKNAHLLIHQLSSVFWGKMNEIEDEKKNLDTLHNLIKRIYLQYTSVPEEELDEMLKHDLWWDADTCLKYGIIDEIL